jgi:signal transduction histidine kinase
MVYKTQHYVPGIIIVILWMFGSPLIVNGQRPFIRQYLAAEYNGGENHQITQDKYGLLYVANSDGLLTFDGSGWGLITLPNHLPVFAVAIDSQNHIYVSGRGELGYFEQLDGRYIYHSLMRLLPVQYRDQLNIEQVVVAGDDIVFNDYKHLFIYRDGQIKVVDIAMPSPDEYLIGINGNIYFVRNEKIYIYKDGYFIIADFQAEGGVAIKYIEEYTQGQYIILDRQDNLWILDPARKAGEKMRLVTDQVSAYLHGAETYQLKYLSNGLIAILAEGNLIFLRSNGEKAGHIEPQVLQYIYLTSIFEDDRHNIWIAGGREILQVISHSPLSFYDNDNGIHHEILSLCEDDKYLYVGTGWGLYVNEKGSSQFKVIHGADGNVWNIYRYQDDIYMVHQTGIWKLKGEQKEHIVEQENVLSMCRLKGNNEHFIYGTVADGIWLLKRKNGVWLKKRISGFRIQTQQIQEGADGSIWISHSNRGIFKLYLNEAKDSVVRSTFYDSRHGLPSDVNNRVWHLESLNKIVVTTVNGIYILNEERQRFEPYKPINTALGTDICIYTVAENAAGDIYFWGAKKQVKEFGGLLRKMKDGSYALITTPFNKIEVPIHDLRVEVDAPVLVSEGGHVLFGNDLRLVFYDPEQKTFFDDPLDAGLKHVWADDVLIYSAANKQSFSELPYSLNNLRFEANCMLYEDSEKLKYQYKLEGFDDHWSEWGSSGEAAYTNLPDGHYTFLMRAKDQYERISAPVSFSFTIRPPWYKTMWAVMALLSFIIWLVYFIVKIYTWRVKEQKRVLQQRVNEQNKELLKQNEELSAMNDQLATVNEHIHEQNREISDQAKELEKLNETKDKLFSIVSHDLRGPVRQVEDILNLITLNYLSEEEFRGIIPGLRSNVRQTLNLTENLLFWARNQMEGIKVAPSVFDVGVIVDENVKLLQPLATGKSISIINTVDKVLPVYADSDMIRLVLRNLMSNAVKFTPVGGMITIACKRSEKYTEVSVEDTGIGLTNDEIAMLLNEWHFSKYGTSGEKGTGIGFGLCREFVGKNGGTVAITSELHIGSKFLFTIPNDV